MNLFQKMIVGVGRARYLYNQAVSGKPISAESSSEAGWNILGSGVMTAAGERITEKTAMQVVAVYACVKILAETVGMLPLVVYKRLPDGGKEKAGGHPLYRILHDSPNDFQTASEFKQMMEGHAALRGNAYAEIKWRFGLEVDSLTPLHPDSVTPTTNDEGVYAYEVKDPKTQRTRKVQFSDMFHLKGLSSDGLVGLSPIQQARESLGISRAAEKFGGSFFGNGANAGNVLQHPSKLSPEAKVFLKESISEHTGSDNSHKTLILEEGMEWHHLGVTPEESQFLQTRKFQVTDIARLFRIPPHLLADLEKATFSNIEHQSLEFVIYSMMPWFVAWEQIVAKKLLVAERDKDYFVEFMADALLRGDTKTRYDAYAVAINTGFMNRNEVRALENLSHVEGLDEYLVPLNMGDPNKKQDPNRTGDKDGQTATTIKENKEPFAVLFSDATDRIVSAENRTWEKHNRRSGNWVTTFNIRHLTYIKKTIQPIAQAFEQETGRKVDAELLADCIINSLSFENKNRAEQIKNLFVKTFLEEKKDEKIS